MRQDVLPPVSEEAKPMGARWAHNSDVHGSRNELIEIEGGKTPALGEVALDPSFLA